MHGITLLTAPADWEIIQQEGGFGTVRLAGTFRVHHAAVKVGVEKVTPIVRVMSEQDNTTVVPWTPMDAKVEPDFSGTFDYTFSVPAGGLYRIETSLETKSTQPNLTWLFRGDCVLHLGVGDLFIIAGQSNSAGYGRDYAMDPPHMCVHLYRNRGCWDLACHPMNESTAAGSLPNEEMGIPGVSPYLSFGKNFYELSRRPVGLIETALGGSTISRWDPETGKLYANMLDKIHKTGGKYAGVLWYQGCSDGEPASAPGYFERFAKMVGALRRELGYDIPFFTFQLNRFVGCREDDAWGRVREAQRAAANSLPHVTVLPTTNCPMSDGIHNSAHANVMLGEKLARQAAHYLLGTAPFEAPAIESAVCRDGKSVCLSFSHMALGFVCSAQGPAENGFFVEDTLGAVPLEGFRANREDKNRVYLTCGRELSGGACVSFAWQADPTRTPPVDEVTYLPPLSFYRFPIAR